MAVATIQTALSAGEISPELYGEVDLAKSHAAATTLRNFVVGYKGGAFSRGGLALVGRCLQSTLGTGPPRPIPFQFSITQGYVLEFGDQYIRFIFQGGYVVENPVACTGVTKANPAVASVTGTPYANADWVFASTFQGMTQLNGNTYIVASSTSGHFALHDLNGVPVDSTGFGTYTSGGEFSRIYTIASPYAAIDLPYLKFSQSADVTSLTCSNPVTGTEYPPYDLVRLSAIDWTLAPTDFDPVIAPPTTLSATANTQAPTSGINATFAYEVTSVDALGNESVASVVATCHGADLQVEAGTNTVTWPYVAGAKFYNVYRAPPSVDTVTGGGSTPNPVPDGSIFGFVGSSYGTQFVDNEPVSNLAQTPPTHQNPFAPGQILAVDVTGGGSGLSGVTYVITTTNGVNFTGFPVVIGGSLAAFVIINPGELYQPGDSIALNGVGYAAGAIEFGVTNPSPLDTITLNSVVWTFVTAITGANQTLIQGALSATLQLLVSNLSSSASGSLTVARYAPDESNSNLIITYKTGGVGGNAYTLAASRATPSHATLTGGSGSGAAGVVATGSLAFSLNPTNGQTIILDGITWTFFSAGGSGNQTQIGSTLAATLTQLQLDLTASPNPNIGLANYSVTSTQLNVAYKIVGTIGNSYTLGGGTTDATPSAATLTGGAAAATVPTATLDVGPTSGTYPGVNTYFQQRHFFACSFNNPDTFWASQTGLYRNFDTRIPTIATDAITASPWTEQVNGIQWLIPMPGGLIAMTGNRAWQIIGQGSYQLNVQPVTPSTTDAQPQAFNGCSATIPPIVIDYDVIYVEAIGNTTVRDLSWNFWVNIYTGADLTILSSHLFLYRQIVQWTWARTPYKVLWAACNDGTMLSMTYLKEQEVYGWTRHDTQGLVVGVTSVTEPPVNAVYVAVQRFVPYAPFSIYTMERMDDRIWQSVEDAYAVDSAVSNPMASPAFPLTGTTTSGAVVFSVPNAFFSAGSVGQVIRMNGGIAVITSDIDTFRVNANWVLSPNVGPAGFPYAIADAWTISTPVTSLNAPHLAGLTVVGLADGVPIPLVGGPAIVVGATGTITLPFAASDVKVGLPFLPQVQTVYLNGNGVTQGARKVIPAATMRVAASGRFQYGTNQPDGAAQNPPQLGPTWSNMAVCDPLNPTGGQDPPPSYTSPGGQTVTQLWTGDLRVVGEGAGWSSKGQVAIQQTLPLPLEITAIEPEALPGDMPEVTYAPRQGAEQQPRGPGRWQLGQARI